LRVANERKFSIKDLYVEPKRMAELIALLETGKITNIVAKRVYEKMISENRTPSEIIEREGLVVERTEDKLTEMAKEVLKENEAAVRDYKKGKKTAIKHLLGSLMKKSKGRADPKIAEKILEQLLKE
jgi:aspartyl-tRNA(Asn)/glutamyl-tRNA(Gln) amidotransferase subunit B